MSKYPRGKLNQNDEGKLSMRFFIRDETLVIDFGKPVAWIGLGVADVVRLRAALETFEGDLREAIGVLVVRDTATQKDRS